MFIYIYEYIHMLIWLCAYAYVPIACIHALIDNAMCSSIYIFIFICIFIFRERERSTGRERERDIYI